jgi:hypothetical protein
MKNYSIIRVGNEYVVQADDKSILKTTSKRRAARFITEAAALLELQPVPPLAPEADAGAEPSISCDPAKVS